MPSCGVIFDSRVCVCGATKSTDADPFSTPNPSLFLLCFIFIFQPGELVFCGATNWDRVGRKSCEAGDSLYGFKRLRAFCAGGAPTLIRAVFSGPSACHSVAVAADGTCYVWGRNEHGQLGLGDVRHVCFLSLCFPVRA